MKKPNTMLLILSSNEIRLKSNSFKIYEDSCVANDICVRVLGFTQVERDI